MHLQRNCVLVHIECAYKERGCNLKPIRGEMKSHLVNCRFQPKHLKCGHNINLGEFEGDVKDCPDYPLSCVNCGFIFMRGELEAHKCLPFLSEKVKSQEIVIRDIKEVHEEMKAQFEVMNMRAQFEGIEVAHQDMRAQFEGVHRDTRTQIEGMDGVLKETRTRVKTLERILREKDKRAEEGRILRGATIM